MATMGEPDMQRRQRRRTGGPSVPWALESETDLVAVDTTWGELQPIQAADGVPTIGELELIELVEAGATVVDCRSTGTTEGRTIPGSVQIPHDEIADRRAELDPHEVSILFCNGPQCPQSPHAVRRLVETGHPATALAYYRGGMHDWVTLAMPTEPTDD